MGIPHLTRLLQPHAIPTVVGCKTPQCKKHRFQRGASLQQIIIDGPGLAYHVYQKILDQKPRTINALDAMPTYSELGYATIALLNELESYGLKVYDTHDAARDIF